MNPDINVSVTLPAPIQVSVSQPSPVELAVSNIGGRKGDDGAPGYTPIKGVDYFDGATGPAGTTDYTQLTNKPTLGTAAATDSTAYATAAQGAKADTATQPADLTTGLNTKANTIHTHSIADVSDLQTQLAGKQASGDYATTTALTDGLAAKQDTLISGTSLKTINGSTLLGSGDLTIAGGGGGGATDHGALTGLTDDDHPQYALKEGSDILFNQANGAYDYKVGGNTLDNMIHVRKFFDRIGFGVQPDYFFHVGGDAKFDGDVEVDGIIVGDQGVAAGNGGFADASKIINVDHTVVQGQDNFGFNVIERYAATANNANIAFGGYILAQIASGNTFNYTGGLRGAKIFTEHNGTGVVSNSFAAEFQVKNNSTGTVNSAIGVNIGATDNGGGGTVGTAIGLQIGDQNTAGTNYAIYTGAGDVNLGDDLEIRNSANGVILKSPNGTRYRITVDDNGILTTTSI